MYCRRGPRTRSVSLSVFTPHSAKKQQNEPLHSYSLTDRPLSSSDQAVARAKGGHKSAAHPWCRARPAISRAEFSGLPRPGRPHRMPGAHQSPGDLAPGLLTPVTPCVRPPVRRLTFSARAEFSPAPFFSS